LLEDKIESTGFLFAIAVKRTTRSDRLYQPLFEANVLKYLIEVVLRGPAFRFYAHLNSFDAYFGERERPFRSNVNSHCGAL
jgi:hypothetical protein